MAVPLNEEIIAALKILQKYQFKEAEQALKQEAGLANNEFAKEILKFKAQVKDEPETFGAKYDSLLKFIDRIPDCHKLELSSLMYPIFVHLYLRLICGDLQNEAKRFLETYRNHQEEFYQPDIVLLASINHSDQLLLNPLVQSFKSSDFVISIASSSYTLLKQFLQENNMGIIQRILNDQLSVQVIDGPPRTKLQLDCRRGAIFGEAMREINREPVLCGLLNDPALASLSRIAESNPLDGENNVEQGGDEQDNEQTPNKKKKRRDSSGPGHSGAVATGSKTSSNAPPLDRIPLPKLHDSFIEARRALARETAALLRTYRQQQQQSGTLTADPMGTSVVQYTVCNVQPGESAMAIRRGGITCACFTENHAGWLAAGFGSGRIRVWSLGPESLRRMLPARDLADLDKDDGRVRTKMLHDENDEMHPTRDLLGHTGSVHGVAFSPDRQLIVSAGSDGTVRLWSSQLWGGALTMWRDHVMPVWSVAWAPVYGHYVVSGGADRTAHLYATDHAPDALRVFTGHHGDVTVVAIHPNINYVATGSADRAVRLFDVRSGKMTRLYTGHKGSVQCLAFSPCGRYLASGGWCGTVCLWDLGTGHQVGQLGGFLAGQSQENTISSPWLTGPVVSLAYCPDNSGRLAAGGLDGALRIWDVNSGRVSRDAANANPTHPGLVAMHRATKQQIHRGQNAQGPVNPHFISYYSSIAGPEASDQCLRESFFTRRTSILALQYVHPYLLLSAGPYNQV